MGQPVTATDGGVGSLKAEIGIGPHQVVADDGKDAAGQTIGPEPHDYLLAGLGACTAITVRLYADRKKYPLERITVHLSRRKVKAADCTDCRTKEGDVEEMIREIELVGPLDEAARTRLLEIAERCPVHRTLIGEIKIRTSLIPAKIGVVTGA